MNTSLWKLPETHTLLLVLMFYRYRGGLDVTNDQTGEYSIHTEYKDREIIFHVSTLLPHDPGDTQHVSFCHMNTLLIVVKCCL